MFFFLVWHSKYKQSVSYLVLFFVLVDWIISDMTSGALNKCRKVEIIQLLKHMLD